MALTNLIALKRSLSPFVVFIFVLLFPGLSLADVPVTLYDQWLIPDSINAEDFTFADLDNNGETELILENDDFIARYSLAQQVTLDYFLKPPSDKQRKFAYGFVDEDPGLDFMEIIMLPDDYPDSCRLMAVPYMSADLWLPGDSVELLRFPSFYEVFIYVYPYADDMTQWGFGDQFFATDAASDIRLWGEIRLTYSVINDFYDPSREDGTYTHRITYSFHPGETAAETGVSLPPFSGDKYTLPGDPAIHTILFEIRDRWTTFLKWCSGTIREVVYIARIYREFDLVNSHIPSNLCECPYPDMNQQFCGCNNSLKLKEHTVGDVLAASPGYELLVFESHYGSNDDGCYCREYHLRCFDLSAPESLTEEWDLPVGESEKDIVFLLSDPAFPDQFFSFAHGKFILRDADGGATLDSSVAVDESAGEMIAYKPLESNGSSYAIFRNDNLISLYSLTSQTDVSETTGDDGLPRVFTLHQPFPNPFNSTLTIPVSLESSGRLSVQVYNLLGQRVASIHDGIVPAGRISLHWNGKDDSDQPVASGIYLIRAATEAHSSSVKCLLLK